MRTDLEVIVDGINELLAKSPMTISNGIGLGTWENDRKAALHSLLGKLDAAPFYAITTTQEQPIFGAEKENYKCPDCKCEYPRCDCDLDDETDGDMGAKMEDISQPVVKVQELHKKNRYEVFFSDSPILFEALRHNCRKVEQMGNDSVKFYFHDLEDNSVYNTLNDLVELTKGARRDVKIVSYKSDHTIYETLTINGYPLPQEPVIDFNWVAGGDVRYLLLVMTCVKVTSNRI